MARRLVRRCGRRGGGLLDVDVGMVMGGRNQAVDSATPTIDRWLLSHRRQSRVAEMETFLPFPSDMPNGSSRQKPTFSVCPTGLTGDGKWVANRPAAREAIVRFTVDHKDKESVLMYAMDMFDAWNCETSRSRGRVGAPPSCRATKSWFFGCKPRRRSVAAGRALPVHSRATSRITEAS